MVQHRQAFHAAALCLFNPDNACEVFDGSRRNGMCSANICTSKRVVMIYNLQQKPS